MGVKKRGRERMDGKDTGHVLVCLSSSPSNERIVRMAAHMAAAFSSRFTALFVETPDFAAATPENKRRLNRHQMLAQSLGASVETVYGEDVAHQIAEFARLSGVTQIVVGRSAVRRRLLRWGRTTLTEQLSAYAPEAEIHIIPDRQAEGAYHPKKAKTGMKSIALNVVKSVAMLLGATALGLLLDEMGATSANIIMVYILGVLLTSAATTHQVYSLVSSVASVIVFNYMFTAPRYSLTAYETGYPVTFIVMFLTAFITGTFAIRYKKQAGQAAKIARRTKTLFDTNQMLSRAESREEILCACAQQLTKLLGRSIVICEAEQGETLTPRFFHADGKQAQMGFSPDMDIGFDPDAEIAAMEQALKAGRMPASPGQAHRTGRYDYFTLHVSERVYGVIGVEAKESPMDAFEQGILTSILGECALALENEKNAREKESAAILAQSEQLRANLLRTISHDLRTPLTSIHGHAANLISREGDFDPQTRMRLYTDIYDDSVWLISLVENLLSATRIEEGHMTLNRQTELISEIVEEGVRRVGHRAQAHRLSVEGDEDLLLVHTDAKLIVQVIVNIIDNAVKYTPAGSMIRIAARREGDMALVSIADDGEGIPNEEKERVFEQFYCGNHRIADNRRSLGLGLYLCRMIIRAHGGEIWIEDNEPKGTVFCFTLPLEEVDLHE